MITAKQYKKYLDFAYQAYQENNNTNQEYRQKGNVPFINHVLWCGTVLLADTKIPWKQRELGFKVLILHDVLEDTSLKLPHWVEPQVKKYVRQMTFKDWYQALTKIPQRSIFVKLLIVIDLLASIYELHVGAWKRFVWKRLARKLLKEVEEKYGNIRIIQMGTAILKDTNW